MRGLYRATNGQLFAAVGSGIYYIAPNWTSTLLGTTAVNTTPISFSDNGSSMVIVDGSAFGWTVDLATHTYAALSDPSFFGSTFVRSLDTFLLFSKPLSNIFYCSLSNSTAFDPLAFAAKVGYPDNLAGIAVQNRNPWLVGAQSSSEIWFDAGAADFPFQIMPGPFVEHGADAVYSIQQQGGSVFWSSQDANGKTIIVEGTNFSTRKISTSAIEYAISTYPVTSDAVSCCFEFRGHAFYQLLFPSANSGLGITWVYDLTTQLWAEWSWLNPATCEPEGHRAFCAAYAYGVNVVGDRQTGQLYMLDENNPTDAGAFIERRRGYPHMMADGNRASYPTFVADMEAATPNSTSPPPSLPAGLASPLTFPATVTVIDTSFVAANGTLLENYNSIDDTGSQYTLVAGSPISAEIENDVLTGAGSGATEYLASGVPTSADYIVRFQAVPASYATAPAAGKQVFAIGRANAINQGYQAYIASSGSQYLAVLTVDGAGETSVNAGLLSSGYFQVFLSMQETSVQMAVQRSQDGFWLTSAGIWQADFAIAISLTDATYTAKGNVLIGGTW